MKNILLLFFLLPFSSVFGEINLEQKKLIICGVCRDVEQAFENTKQNIEMLGLNFADYVVIIYENNSTDKTALFYKEWAKKNPKIIFISEKLTKKEPASKTEKIARARNIVLSKVRNLKYQDFEYLMMVDLDFLDPWPLNEILETIKNPREWDCVSANGVHKNKIYHDRFAYRGENFPLGPEILKNQIWWNEVKRTQWVLSGTEWVSAYSAFGGMAIYKTASIINFSYSGIVTSDLKKYYKQIITSLPKDHPHIKQFLKQSNKKDLDTIQIKFRKNSYNQFPENHNRITCCEHLPLHASMALHGFGKFYINPKMYLFY